MSNVRPDPGGFDPGGFYGIYGIYDPGITGEFSRIAGLKLEDWEVET